MPEHLRAFVVVLTLSVLTFAIIRKPVIAWGMGEADFRRRRNLWLLATSTAFLAHNFWIFVAVMAIALLIARKKESSPLACYFFLLFAVPPFATALPGLGVVNQLFSLNFPRVLAFALLLPWVLKRREWNTPGFGKYPTDWFFAGFLLLEIGLQMRADTVTNALRSGLHTYLEVFLPYFLASRSLKTVDDFRDALLSLCVAALLMVPIAVYEFFKHWLLYAALTDALGMVWGSGDYLARGVTLRPVVSTGHSIVLGSVMMTAMLLFSALRPAHQPSRLWSIGMAALAAGLMVAVSRGPWVGAAAGVVVLAISSRLAVRQFLKLLAITSVGAAAMLASPWGANVVAYLPFVGTIDVTSVAYRQRLFEVSMQVISQSPFFGSPYFMYSAPMEELRVGNLIDIVNSYLLVALRTGYVGLALFAGVFVTAILLLVASLHAQGDHASDRFRQGQAILAALASILVTIATVSNISFVPFLYWSLAGLAIGYVHAIRSERYVRQAAAPWATMQSSRGHA